MVISNVIFYLLPHGCTLNLLCSSRLDMARSSEQDLVERATVNLIMRGFKSGDTPPSPGSKECR